MTQLPNNNPSTTTGGIEYWEQIGNQESGKEELSVDRWSATRVMLVRWSDRLAFAKEILGGVSAGRIYTPPLAYPDIPAIPARKISMQGVGKGTDSGSQVSYPFALCTVLYELDEERREGDRLSTKGELTENLSLSAEVITFGEGTFKWQTGASVYDEDGTSVGTVTAALKDATIKESPGKIMPTAEYTLEFSHHPAPPWSSISALIGKLNSSTFNPLAGAGLSFAERRLIFAGVDSRRNISFDPGTGNAISAYRLVYKFLFRRVPWDLLYKPLYEDVTGNPLSSDVAGYTKPLDENNDPIFDVGNFNLLI